MNQPATTEPLSPPSSTAPSSTAPDPVIDSRTEHPPKPNRSHPLMGANLRTLVGLLFGNGRIPARSWPLLLAAVASAIARLPFSLAERLFVAWKRRRQRMPPPVFIVGHWRSGTTHLYNVLSRSPQFGFVSPVATGLPWDFLLIGRLFRRWLERALPEERFIDRVPVNPDSPQEDEIGLASMQGVSFYHGIYFPRRLRHHFLRGIFFDGCSEAEVRRWRRVFRHFMEKLSLLQPGRQLLIKNPVYTARVADLHRMWPEARFIHIYRNPYEVYQSTRNFYAALLREFSLQPYNAERADPLILEGYPRMMQALEADAATLPANRYIELRYEDFMTAPMEHLERIYQQLELPGFAAARAEFADYLEGVKSYQKNRYRYPEEDNARVRAHWAERIDRLGYEPPGEA